MTEQKEKTYEISALRFVPGYNDWDIDFTTINATSEEEAMIKFKKYKWIYKGLHIKEVSE